ncbi:efflux RND transporter periplasmic adaptor subunit [Alysiella filiformis]|uniref:Membrane fusion protein, multidrug efflux system n=1 Tax=Alysiella filiformis DSM 16848 TaxID=1120981 RepID=A0A286E2Y1_9NEIS|nr:efflux RND transporter periplasmic adaptor subunit [Alysiella filiformis]QMT31156.1 efflux RND transporter periplasmic adaptor subunit [Alysiella filiformis]UBQ55851.1 efflux RND transporter periplasmic adaptor subunit [Alysiella filiformis DSM 16848]SOD65252.1 membrane fusion protein, multidrug efflux system [Alysiella filiformis DSM 16848]
MNISKNVQPTWRFAALALASALALAACGNKVEEQKKAQQAKMAELTPTVHVLTVYPQNVLLENNLPARLEATRSADIIPQVGGIVQRRLFQEGSYVKAGQPLYQLDDDTYTANLATAKASLLSAEAALAKADADLARYRSLVQADAISKQEWDAAVTAKRSAEAQIESAKAAIHAANVNVKRAQIVAPISGFIGQSLVTEGALVAANSTKMANITQNDPMYVNITQSSADMLKLRKQLATGERVMNSHVDVSIVLEDGSVYPEKGRLLFSDATVDKTTGQVTLRAAIPNPQQVLMSGMYVRVNLPLAGILDAFAVPQKALTRGKTDTVMVVNAQGGVEPRTVKVGGQKGDAWIVTEGLQAGDRVVVDGMSIAGMLGAKKFDFKEWQPEQSANPNPQEASPMTGSVPHDDAAERASEVAAPAAKDVQAASEAQ